MTTTHRVVVTGIGQITPLGLDEAAMRAKLFSGETAVRKLEGLDPASYRSQNAAQIDSQALTAALSARGSRPGDRTTDLAILATAQALEQAGLLPAGPGTPAEETGVVFGTGNGPSHALQESWQTYYERGGSNLRPTTVPRCMISVISSQVSIKFGLKGSNYIVSSACSSSSIALGIGFRMIRHGDARRVLCGGSESMLTPALYAGWDRLGVMSTNPDPARACRPFDAARDGFVLGEGAGTLVLESLDEARARGARIRAEILGFGESSDGTHITRPSVDGQAACMAAALRSAGLAPSAIDFVNAHGTATKANDQCEAEAIHRVFGDETARLPISASKSYVGHLLGAAGIVETIIAIACLEEGRLHRNLNLDQPDPACDVRVVGVESLAVPLRIFMKNSFGFGGSNSTLIVGRYEG